MKRISPKQFARSVPVAEALRSSVVAKRRMNNDRKSGKGHGLRMKVSDNDPMAKDSESNWP